MSFEIKKATLGDFLNFKNGKKSPERADNASFPVFGSNGLIGRAESTNCPDNTIVIGRVGSYCGSVHFSKEKCWVSDNAISCSSKNAGEEHFWFYVLTKLNLNQFSSGSGQPLLNQATLNAVECEVPNNPSIRALIGNVLNDYDNKIKLNAATNQTLEEMAQAIFKSWFVDFDPVKAKMNGEQPEGMGAATASLFPEKLVESELGLIPEGWKVGELTELAKLDTTSVKPNKEPETIWEHYSIPAFDDGYYPSFDTGESIKSNKYKVKANAVLVSKLNPRFQRIWLPLPMHAEQAICSTEFMQFVPNVSVLKPYLYSLVKSTPFQNELMNTVTGTTGSRQRAQPKQVAKAQVVVPPSQLMELFSEKVGAMFTMTQQNIRQSIELAKMRDTLLPKLLSGEIDLEKAQNDI